MTDMEMLELAAKAAGKKERHGMNKSPEHRAWVHMKQRCTNPNKKEYPHYGGRGIRVCDEWMHSFLSFYHHVGPRPSDKHSIDRIDVNGNYEPGNVRWATQQEQVENTTVVRMITIGEKTQSVAAWEREMGLSKGQVKSRENRGWSTEKAIMTPSVKGQKVRKYVPQGYSRLKSGWFRVMIDGKYIKTVRTEDEAKELVAATRRAIVRAAAQIGAQM